MDRLIQRLHEIFDKQALPERALTLRAGTYWADTIAGSPIAAEASWGDGDAVAACEIKDRALILSRLSGSEVISLSEHTIGSLASALVSAGLDVDVDEASAPWLSATTLLDAQAFIQPSGEFRISRFTSLLWALSNALTRGLQDASEAIEPALSQLILPTSTGEWADLFGSLMGIARWPGEEDAAFTQRMLDEVRRERSNPVSMALNIRRLTGYSVEVREPWKEIMHLSAPHPLSGSYALQGGGVYEYHRIQLVARVGTNAQACEAQAQADRPAGTLLLPTKFVTDPIVVTGILDDVVVGVSRADSRGIGTDGLRDAYEGGWASLGWNGLWDDRMWSRYVPFEEFVRHDIAA